MTAYNSSGAAINILEDAGYARDVKFSIGFPMPAFIETLPIEYIEKGSTSMGRTRRINEVTFNLDNSGAFLFGTTTLDRVIDGEITFSGQITATVDSDYNTNDGSYIVSNAPNLLNVLSFSPELTINR